MLVDAEKLFDRLMEEWEKEDIPEVYTEQPHLEIAYRFGRSDAFKKALDILRELKQETRQKGTS